MKNKRMPVAEPILALCRLIKASQYLDNTKK